MGFKERMDPLDKLFTLFFVFSPIVIGIFTSFGLDVRLLWIPMIVLFVWALYIYQYRAVYVFSDDYEFSLIERVRGLAYFLNFPVLSILHGIALFTSFADLLARGVIFGTAGAICSIAINFSIPRAFFGRITLSFRESEKRKLSDILWETSSVASYFSLSTIIINSAILSANTVVVILSILVAVPFGVFAYRCERKSRRITKDLSTSLHKNKRIQQFLHPEKKGRKP
jgi:hypothetical protein